MNFQVVCFIGTFNFVSFQAAERAALMTGGKIFRILGKRNNQHVVGSAI